MPNSPSLTMKLIVIVIGICCLWGIFENMMSYSVARVDSWISRELCDASFELPRAYRVAREDQHFDRSQPWFPLNQGRWKPTIYSLVTDDGLVLEARSVRFALPMMRTVCVPWSSVRVEVSTRVTREWTVQILYPEGTVARSFTIDRYDRQWREAVSHHLARFQQAPVTHSPSEGKT